MPADQDAAETILEFGVLEFRQALLRIVQTHVPVHACRSADMMVDTILGLLLYSRERPYVLMQWAL